MLNSSVGLVPGGQAELDALLDVDRDVDEAGAPV
jgi:hypothetical protein